MMANCIICGIELTNETGVKRYDYSTVKLRSRCRECFYKQQKLYRKSHRSDIKVKLESKQYHRTTFDPRRSRREWLPFANYMRLNPVYFHQQFGKEYTEHNVFSEYKRLDKLMQERGI